MQTYFIQLGNTPALSMQELEAVLGADNVRKVTEFMARTKLKDDEEAQELIDALGGSVKFVRMIEKLEDIEEEDLITTIARYLSETEDKKVHFGLSEFGRDHLSKLNGFKIKEELKSYNKSARLVEGSRHGLSAAILLHKKRVIEIYLIQTEEGVFLGRTVSVQNIDNWTNKDRNKPYSDRKKGMLPPKVALMMLNISLGDNPTEPDRKNLLLDPFCGTGTVLSEALLADLDVIGTDLDADSVIGTRKNIEWLRSEYNITKESKIMVSDSTKVPEQPDKIQYIVTEPFLGQPKPNPAKLSFIYRGLKKLYIGSFKRWTKILADGASVVIVFPTVTIEDKKGREINHNLDSLIDKLAALGYTTQSRPVLYHRPNAIVQRQIYRFKFNNKE